LKFFHIQKWISFYSSIHGFSHSRCNTWKHIFVYFSFIKVFYILYHFHFISAKSVKGISIFQCLLCVSNLLLSRDIKMNKTQTLATRIPQSMWQEYSLHKKINNTIEIYCFFRSVFLLNIATWLLSLTLLYNIISSEYIVCIENMLLPWQFFRTEHLYLFIWGGSTIMLQIKKKLFILIFL
jgi:hypothetical protein